MVGIDIVVVLTIICFINLLEKRYREYAYIFDKRNVEMRDFSLEIENLPFDHEYGGKDIMLQAQLWNHIELTVQKAMEWRAVRSGNQVLLDRIREERHWEIVDLTFSLNDMNEIEMLEKLNEIDRNKKTKIFKVKQILSGKDKSA